MASLADFTVPPSRSRASCFVMNPIEPRFTTEGQQVGTMIYPMVQYSQRLLLAMQRAGQSIASLHKALGISYQAVKKAVDGGKFGTANHLKAAKLLRVNPEWLATGIGEMHAPAAFVDHSVSYQPFDHPHLTREGVMTMGGEDLPARFTFTLADDAMGEHGRAGMEVLFHAASTAKGRGRRSCDRQAG